MWHKVNLKCSVPQKVFVGFLFFNGISTFVGLFTAKANKNFFNPYLGVKEGSYLPNDISPKVNVITQLEFELAY